MEYTENKLMLLFLIIAIIALLSSIIIDYVTPGGQFIDYTEFIDYIAVFSIVISIIFGIFKKK